MSGPRSFTRRGGAFRCLLSRIAGLAIYVNPVEIATFTAELDEEHVAALAQEHKA